ATCNRSAVKCGVQGRDTYAIVLCSKAEYRRWSIYQVFQRERRMRDRGWNQIGFACDSSNGNQQSRSSRIRLHLVNARNCERHAEIQERLNAEVLIACLQRLPAVAHNI